MTNLTHQDLRQRLVTFLQKNEAFADFSKDDLAEFADLAKFGFGELGQQVIQQDGLRYEFLMVLSGELQAVDISQKPPTLLNYHAVGSILGTRALLYNLPRAATVEVVADAHVAVFEREAWDWLVEKHPETLPYLRKLEQDYSKQALLNFPGRQADEVVIKVVKPYSFALLPLLVQPVTLLVLAGMFFFLTVMVQNKLMDSVTNLTYLSGLATLVMMVVGGLSTLSRYLDWRKDEFIVTSKRIIHFKRLLFLAEERQEAPLTRLQNISLNSEGKFNDWVDCHELEIKTAGAGTIKLPRIHQAESLQATIWKAQEQVAARLNAADAASIRHSLARRLDWQVIKGKNTPTVGVNEEKELLPKKGQFSKLLDYLRPQIKENRQTAEEGELIIWHQHYAMLGSAIFWPMLFLVTFTYLLLVSWPGWWPFTEAATALTQIAMGVAILLSGLWYFWEYESWRRDVYLLSSSHIVAVHGTPFQRRGEQRQEETFAHVQNITYHIPNFYSKLLNLGDVTIETTHGENSLIFKNVLNPSDMQQEIFSRLLAFQQQEREKERQIAASQVVEMIGEYHHLFKRIVPKQQSLPNLKKAA